jgi:hypothetical protein
VENVVAGQLLGRWSDHLLPADDADVVRVSELLSSGVGVEGVHVVDCSSGEHNIIESFLESSHSEVHGAHSKQRQSVDPDHDHKEEDVQQDLDEPNEQLSVKHEDRLVLPWVLTVQVDGVEDILDKSVDDNGEKDGILKPKHQLYTSPLGECGGVGMLDEKQVQRSQDQSK